MLTQGVRPNRASDVFFKTDFFNTDFSNGAIVAISGGSDSTALLILIHDYFCARWPQAKLIAATVDHGLRAVSHDEALKVASLCTELGIQHHILIWDGPKPQTGIPAAGRKMRYRLLAKLARANNIGIILTGHTADDLAETVTMRRERGQSSGFNRGLAGMAPFTLFESDIWIARPFLSTRRQALRALLTARKVDWIDDPTNEDHTYERPRVRSRLDEQQVLSAIQMAVQAANRRRDLDMRTASLIAHHALQPAPGLFHLERALLFAPDREAVLHALRLLLATIGGLSHLPDPGRVQSLLEGLAQGTMRRATLARTLIDARRSGIFLLRELRDLPRPLTTDGSFQDGQIWDGRYRIRFSNHDTHAAALATESKSIFPHLPDRLVQAALGTQPAQFFPGKNVAALPLIAPFAGFLPDFDLHSAGVLAKLVGAKPFPALPRLFSALKNHIGRP
ncbi:tRNA lysidine(34) synthetase TilS [Aquamicrobium segne]|uniref:tRNA(Ile)-lysidine synthase n=1 Tax=Aquamicrobium segne TaxID=469547 RepID=A0ABW0GVE5_9HYPH